jgi:hypothetical protein
VCEKMEERGPSDEDWQAFHDRMRNKSATLAARDYTPDLLVLRTQAVS